MQQQPQPTPVVRTIGRQFRSVMLDHTYVGLRTFIVDQKRLRETIDVSKELLYTCCALTLHRVALLGDSRRLQRR